VGLIAYNICIISYIYISVSAASPDESDPPDESVLFCCFYFVWQGPWTVFEISKGPTTINGRGIRSPE